MKDKEIEIQVKIEKYGPLLEFLENNAKFYAKKHQIDEYFSPAHRDFLEVRPVKEWLRLRNADGKYSINYKNWHYGNDGKSHYCDEFESGIEDFDRIRKIFASLDFKSVIKVDKTRSIWTYEEYEISIDSVKELGEFVEIEYIGEDVNGDPKKITEDMIDFLKGKKVGKIERNYVGYPFMLLFRSEVKYEAQ